MNKDKRQQLRGSSTVVDSKSEVTVQEEINEVRMRRPHVVILGAGASRATCPRGDRNGKALPLMSDFVEVLDLKSKLKELGLDSADNFEDTFSDMWERGDTQSVKAVQSLIGKYFRALELPKQPTIYDHLILSLRGTDLIATFNWDPLLLQAYLRNQKAGLEQPLLAFLHGNVLVGYCAKDNVEGVSGTACRHCGKQYTQTPLLYPIKRKDYSADFSIADAWRKLTWGLRNAFMITIFGYSGPKTDREARAAMRQAWGKPEKRDLEQTALIVAPSDSEETVRRNWDPFIHTHHYEIQKNFYHSWIAKHPRRTGEAYLNQYMRAKFIENNPIPRDADFSELWDWFQRFRSAEEKCEAQ